MLSLACGIHNRHYKVARLSEVSAAVLSQKLTILAQNVVPSGEHWGTVLQLMLEKIDDIYLVKLTEGHSTVQTGFKFLPTILFQIRSNGYSYK